MALTLLRLMPDAGRHDVRILATDIDPTMVDEAREAVYPAETVKDIPAELRRRWVLEDENRPGFVEMAPAVRALVEVRTLNLIKGWPMRGQFQAIFCRNVMIYFDKETQEKILRRFVPLLKPGGILFAGHSENFSQISKEFWLRGQTVYGLTKER